MRGPGYALVSRWASAAACALLLWCDAGCTPRCSTRFRPDRDVRYEVREGDTLNGIARAYQSEAKMLACVNDVDDPDVLEVGQFLVIPGKKDFKPGFGPRTGKTKPKGRAQVGASGWPPAKGSRGAGARAGSSGGGVSGPVSIPSGACAISLPRPLKWPTQGMLRSLFGVRAGQKNDGIDIAAPEGTEIYAAEDGEAAYTGAQAAYGNIILLRHGPDLITVYAHNEKNLVKSGDRVKRGQVIATVGKSGNTARPHLHFEVRVRTKACDPKLFLELEAP